MGLVVGPLIALEAVNVPPPLPHRPPSIAQPRGGAASLLLPRTTNGPINNQQPVSA